MAIINGVAKSADAGGFYPKEIEQSLRFNDNDSAYLSWTPASAGNRKTWTWSGWVKRGNIGIESSLFAAGSSSSNKVDFRFDSNDTLHLQSGNNGSIGKYSTQAVFRDTSSWYHVVLKFSAASQAITIYVNGAAQSLTTTTTLSNTDHQVNSTVGHHTGGGPINVEFDGYLSEVHFTDGTAYDATAFGEFKNGVWVAKEVDVTYGTNGFYLPFSHDYSVEGFSAVTYTGNSSTQYIGGVGFEPDLVWIKSRNISGANHNIYDSVRGAGKFLFSNLTNSEVTTSQMASFDSDGFSFTGTAYDSNNSGNNYVAWCWDAGTGSPVSNTDGSITSTVKANPDYGFSIVSYTGDNSNATIGHGLSSAPDMIINKRRDSAQQWYVWHKDLSANTSLRLNEDTAEFGTGSAGVLGNVGASTFGFVQGSVNYSGPNASGGTYISYCFHSVAGYSDFGSYTGTGASGNKITTGFKPALVMTKMTSSAGNWRIHDSVRSATDPRNAILYPNLSNAEDTDNDVDFDSDGFTIQNALAQENASGQTYIYMAFADTREAAFWLDDSGNNNDWENNNLTESDIVLDSPTNNFATLNPLDKTTRNASLSEGNLRYVNAVANGDWYATFGSVGMTSGKYYWEQYVVSLTTSLSAGVVVGNHSSYNGYNYPFGPETYKVYQNGSIYHDGTTTAYSGTYTTGDVVGVCVDADAREVWISINGVFQGSPTAGTGGMAAAVGDPFPEGAIFPMSDVRTATGIFNFGQDSSFAGNKTPQGYTDANGIGDFYYAPPTGALALCTANLPEPVIGPNSDSTSDEHFNTVLWGQSSTPYNVYMDGITGGLGLTWVKVRGTTGDHRLYDLVRGAGNALKSSTTGAEVTDTTYISAFGDDYFTSNLSTSANNMVAWNWKANGSGVTNTDGSITSTVSANTDAGFSIVSYTANQIDGATVGHGLDSAPEMVIVKARNYAAGWPTLHSPSGNYGLRLNQAGANSSPNGGAWFKNTPPSSTVFTLGTGDEANESGINYIAYCFHSVEGFSKFGSYTGNGSTDGAFVYTGFRPAFMMIKRTDSTSDWQIIDTARSTYNLYNPELQANQSYAEWDGTDKYDILSNGIKHRNGYSSNNASGGTYIFMAFAENPFKYSNAR
jgi:hypothetical protein